MVQELKLDTTRGTQREKAARVKAESRYPNYDLNDSIAVASAIRERGGGEADLPHIASFLNYKSTSSGAFITRIAAARRFGLVENRPNGFLAPTPLAMRIIAPEHPGIDDAQARADAFLLVPLYRNLYDRYKGSGLPPEVGLRNALEASYGIPSSAAQMAVRVFLDSAAQGGFFDARGGARTHLVLPMVAGAGNVIPGMELTDDVKPPVDEVPPVAPAQEESATETLQRVLVEKIKDVPATDLETIREYIKIIRELGGNKEAQGK